MTDEQEQAVVSKDECRKAFEQEFEVRGYAMPHNGHVYENNDTEMAYRGFEAAWHYGEPKKRFSSEVLIHRIQEITPAEGFRLRQDGDVVFHEPIPEETEECPKT